MNQKIARIRTLCAIFAAPAAIVAAITFAPQAAQAQNSPTTFINLNSRKCLDVYNWSKSTTAVIDQWTCGNNQANQLWTPVAPSGGLGYELVNVNSGLCLESDGTPGDDLNQLVCNANNLNEQWDPYGYDVYQNYVNLGDGYCLDAYGSGTSNGTLVDSWYCNNGKNQFWAANVPCSGSGSC
jgi:hypothetical protein